MEKTGITLHRLGICPNYTGYMELRLALRLVSEDPARLTALVRQVYMPVGGAVSKSWLAVERNLRTVIRRAWETNPAFLQEVAGRPLDHGPETGEFLAMMYVYLMDGEAADVM
ncbi:MAG: sporulation initiation factor Spo0A C-terminal domain-containing protein [Clostridiales bacterium]|nr:sporulation initiation factor Spo0A C-terminal domain-containing protein [Clostridiales bacterium]